MEATREDRRKKRSRKTLQDAMTALLSEKGYEQISVQDIIERADVARSTFYMHYQDKDDLLVGPQGLFAEELAHLYLEPKTGDGLSALIWFEQVQARRPILEFMVGNPASELAMNTLREKLREDYQQRLKHRYSSRARVPIDVEVELVVGALTTLICWWLNDDPPHDAAQMDALFLQWVQAGVGSELRPA